MDVYQILDSVPKKPAKSAKVKTKKEAKPKVALPIAVEIGQRVIELRGTRKQEAIAKQARVSRSIVSNIENGYNYTIKQLIKVLRVLGAQVDGVLDIDDLVGEQRTIHRQIQELLLHVKGAEAAKTSVTVLHKMYLGDASSR